MDLRVAGFRARGGALRDDPKVRVVSWNLMYRGAAAALRQGELLRRLGPDLMLLQEVNLGSAETLRQAAGADWLICAADLRARTADDRPVRARGVAIGGRGPVPARAWLQVDVPLPERILLAEITLEGLGLTAVSYHAPPGVSWGIAKPRQAVALARWLPAQQGPVLLGADANTPLIDAADFTATLTHWHTGGRQLHGEPGDDLLFGPGKIHPLDDGLRRWLADHPPKPQPGRAARRGRSRSPTAPAGERTASLEPGGASTPSGSPATGPSGTSAIFTTRASPRAATTPSLSRTSHTHDTADRHVPG